MGMFDLPTGNFELRMKPIGESGKGKWESVCMTDSLSYKDICECVEHWSKKYKVSGARYNGKPVQIPKTYYWVLQCRDERVGHFATYEEAKEAQAERKKLLKDGKIKYIGYPNVVVQL